MFASSRTLDYLCTDTQQLNNMQHLAMEAVAEPNWASVNP
jgi:hypothetical protein